ncbi:unnamed protein product [Triticum turgidum subsp. durum]|uniref:GDSL esterase/lipase n=1 Tax=Triticum turgidum subsp. durum TaxID=4567 RepID=A0A9R1NZI8_TRITD|nr:unnamed protein product [Triticum turgidum subsp. durum]
MDACSPVLVVGALLLVLLGASAPTASAARAFFVFGDSLVDNGNNNYLMTTARADAPPYGIDFPTHMPTGRFSNGLNIPDIISEYLGAEPALPYLSPYMRGENLLVGANFASAGVGILNDTGVQFVNIIRIAQQLQNFQDYQRRLAAYIGEDAARERVSQSLVLITLGGNDFVNNYYLVPFSARSQQFEIHDYVPFIISEYKKVLARLYELGARRVIVTGTGMIGCVPAELALHSLDGSCAPDLTRAADLFNPQLERMLTELNGEVGHDDVFIAANTNRVSFDFMFNPQQYGSRRPRSRAAGRARTTGSGCARRRPTCAPTGTCTPTGTPSTPRSGPTGSSSPTSCTAPPTTSAP